MFQRPHFQIIKKRLEEERKFIQFVIGPRQVGKTTLIAQLIEEIKIPFHSVSADAVPASNQIWLNQQWDIAKLKMQQSNQSNA